MEDLPHSRVDERDTIFARMARMAGTPAYEEYYARRPELKGTDDRLRSMPRLLSPEGFAHDGEVFARADRWFQRIGEIVPDGTLVERGARAIRSARKPRRTIARLLRRLGAIQSGVAPLHAELVYTHKGRFDEEYGRPVEPAHPTAVVFLVEMDYEAMARAPRAETIEESARQYYRAAWIARHLAAMLRAAGHSASAEYDAHYTAILPALAVAAGLGELGRNNILIAHRVGSRCRIGAVTTDLDLPLDRPQSLGAEGFCEVCLKCADNCPPRALSLGEREDVRGVAKWPTKVEACYAYWRRMGTDCGVCMACCPFSHRDNLFHNTVRWLVRRIPSLHPLLVKGDDWLYGRAWKPVKKPLRRTP